MLFAHLCKTIFLHFFYCLNIIIYTLNVASAIKQMTANELRNFIFEKYFKQIGFVKESSYYSKKRLKKYFYCL